MVRKRAKGRNDRFLLTKQPSNEVCSGCTVQIQTWLSYSLTDMSGKVVTSGIESGLSAYNVLASAANANYGTLAAQPNNWTSTEIVMQDTGGTMMAVPSALEGGQAFNVAWRSAT